MTSLGLKLRLFAKMREELENLNIKNWCNRLEDYVHIRGIEEVGSKPKAHVTVRRFRQDLSQENKTHKFAEKYGKSVEEVRASRIEHIAKKENLKFEDAEKLYWEPQNTGKAFY